ncbi:hydroxysqualene dehydroxylase HpnE [bacterium]|nr:hydroxysqualene dehydroxylase HpnE [bacterium]
MPSNSQTSINRRVCIIGGGLAGIACATALAEHGFEVSLYEARKHLGGRAGSYQDQGSNEIIDNCQHVSMGCCTNLQKLCRQLGIADSFETQKQLHFISPDNQITSFGESWLPAPFHLSLAFWRLPYLSFQDKKLFASGVKALAKAPYSELRGEKFSDWLHERHQSPELINRIWEVVLVSSLSESLERIDAAYAKKVFFDGFLANRKGWRVEIPDVSLDDLYSQRTLSALQEMQVNVLPNRRLRRLEIAGNKVIQAADSNDNYVEADEYVLAVPHHQVTQMLPTERRDHPLFAAIDKIETAPISSVHLWLDRRITDLKHAVFVEKFSQWIFSRGSSKNKENKQTHRYQIVISASRNLSNMNHDEIVETVMNELKEVWASAREANVLHFRVITEKRAVFSVTPGIDELRASQATHIPNLHLAGDWTSTNWPATMEGAVRSGYLAAENIIRKYDIKNPVLAPDLKQSVLSRLIFGKR